VGFVRVTTAPVAASYATILGLGEYRPARVVTNAGLIERMNADLTDAWIQTRTGIASRGLAAADESVAMMAAGAAGKALAAAGVEAADVDLVLLASCTQRRPVPGGAAEVGALLGATNAGAFDLNAACAGFCYGLSVASDAVRAGSARYVLVIGAERLSDWLDSGDTDTTILFGDGAGAALVGPAAEPGIGPVVWGSDGSGAELIAVPMGGSSLRMEGRAVFRWATTAMAPVGRRACEAAGVAPTELAAFVPHQANGRIISALARTLGLPPEVVVADDITDTGNTSAASVPLALARLVRTGAVPAGGLALLLGFGAGLTYASQVVRFPATGVG
jgi:3-oxoacyl-[acyl-carrier-protein] synthase-3